MPAMYVVHTRAVILSCLQPLGSWCNDKHGISSDGDFIAVLNKLTDTDDILCEPGHKENVMRCQGYIFSLKMQCALEVHLHFLATANDDGLSCVFANA